MIQSRAVNWHYEHAGQSLGPVSEESLRALCHTGIISLQDRVWRQDWPDWRRAGDVWPASDFASPAASPPSLAPDPFIGSTCEECGAKDPGMKSIGGLPICQNCEPFARDKLSHGMPLGIGPWRHGRQLVMRKDALLPPHCVKCAAPATTELKKRLSWHHPLIYLGLFMGVLPYLVLALCLRKTLTVHLPLCAVCARKRWRNIAISLLGFFASLGLMIAGGMSMHKNESLGPILFFSGLGLFFFFLVWSISIQIVIAKKIDERYAWLSNIGKPWLKTLPPWPYQ